LINCLANQECFDEDFAKKSALTPNLKPKKGRDGGPSFSGEIDQM